jgi:hypothetical protein
MGYVTQNKRKKPLKGVKISKEKKEMKITRKVQHGKN